MELLQNDAKKTLPTLALNKLPQSHSGLNTLPRVQYGPNSKFLRQEMLICLITHNVRLIFGALYDLQYHL